MFKRKYPVDYFFQNLSAWADKNIQGDIPQMVMMAISGLSQDSIVIFLFKSFCELSIFYDFLFFVFLWGVCVCMFKESQKHSIMISVTRKEKEPLTLQISVSWMLLMFTVNRLSATRK